MILIRLLDIIAELFRPRNLVDFARRTRLMWPITRRFLQKRRLQFALMSLAVAMGFTAYLTFQAILGNDTERVMRQLQLPELPVNIIVRHEQAISAAELEKIADIRFLVGLVQALEAEAYLDGWACRLLGFAPDETFWQEQIELQGGSLELTENSVLLPQQLADEWKVGPGDQLYGLSAGRLGPINGGVLEICGTYTSNVVLFDRPIVLATSPLMSGRSLQEPSTVFLDVYAADVNRTYREVRQILSPSIDEVQPLRYRWLVPTVMTGSWVREAARPFTIIYQTRGGFNSLAAQAQQVVANNYSSGNVIIGLVFMFSATSVFNILLIALLTRRRDIGILKTIGFDDMSIFTNFLVEGCIVVGSGIIAGVLLSRVAFAVVESLTGYVLGSSPGLIARSALISFIIFMASAAIPADMARYTTVIELLLERPLRSSWEEDPLKRRPAQNRALVNRRG